MNRTFSFKIPKKPSMALAAEKNEKSNLRKKKQSPSRNPLQDLNAISSCRNSNCSDASSVSMEGPRCCLRFSLSHHPSSSSSSSSNSKLKTPFRRSKTLSKTPKSAPNVRVSKLSKFKTSKENILSKSPVKENPDRPIPKRGQKLKNNPPCPYQWQSGKKPRSRNAQKSKTSSVLNNGGYPVNKSEGEEMARVVANLGEVTELKPWGTHATCTPLTKIASGPGLDCEVGKAVEENSNRSNSKTPPVLTSVSPEILCGSSLVSTTITPGCYGAGPVVSGVTDKRKCRPRGILTVEENDSGFGSVKPFDSFDDFEDLVGIGNDLTVIPEPAEASMHWLLSPCNEDGNQNGNSENELCRLQRSGGSAIVHSPPSPSTGHAFSLDICSDHSTASTTNSNRRRSTLISPNRLPEFDGLAIMSSPHVAASCGAITLKEVRENRCDLESDNSPFSTDSLCSGNVMQTPESDSSSDRLCLSWFNEESYKKHHFESELNSAAEVLQMTTLSPKSQISIRDPVDSRFFDCLTTSSNSINFAKFPKILDDQASWISNSTLDNVSQSQMRTSWREGLVSQIYEKDDSDCCRCLSDEEEDANDFSNDRLKPHHNPVACVDVASDQISTNNSRSAEFVDNDSGTYGKGKGQFCPHISCSCAESISTDGGGLVASRDSDWSLC